MNKIFILLLMIFLHILDDFYLQPGILSDLKQKDFWKKNAPDKLYRYDYIWALLIHSFSWSFMIMLPLAYVHDFKVNILFTLIFLFNIIVHAIVDDAKANKKLINLWVDQLVHLVQIGTTLIILGDWYELLCD